MNQLPRKKQNGSMSDKTKIIIVPALMGIGILLLIALVAYALRGSFPTLQFFLPAPATQTQPFPTLSISTPYCGSPTLVVGTTTFQIQELAPATDGTVTVPDGTNGVAYQVTGLQNTFLLSSTPENAALMTSLPEGATAKVTLTNCNSVTYSLSAPQPAAFSTLPAQDPSAQSIVLFVPTDASGNGLAANGSASEDVISTFNTPDPNQGVQAEIGLLETTASPDGTTIQVKVSIYNYGQTPFSLTANDVSLTPQGGAPLAMVSSDPALPKEIAPGKTEEFAFTFPRPTTLVAVLKVFTVEYDLEGY